MKKYIKPDTEVVATASKCNVALPVNSEYNPNDGLTKETGGWDYGDDTNDW